MSPRYAGKKKISASFKEIRQICLEEGADDVGFVDLDRDSLAKERDHILGAYPRARSIIALIKAMNRENIQSTSRNISNDEYHSVGDEFSGICRRILRRLNQMNIRGIVPTKSWPMDLNRWPGRIWDISHKIMATEAGLGKMGLNRLVLHPRYGSFIQLHSIVIDTDLDAYDHPLSVDPCLNCNLCATVCPTGAISKTERFDFFACSAHTYRDNMNGFQNWIDAMVSAKDISEYRTKFDDRETAYMWQSLMFRMSYRCSYCVAVCPAGEDVKPLYLQNKSAYVKQIMKPLLDKAEPVYVKAGSKAEAVAGRNPHKEVRKV